MGPFQTPPIAMIITNPRALNPGQHVKYFLLIVVTPSHRPMRVPLS